MAKRNENNKAFLMHDTYEAGFDAMTAEEAKGMVMKMFGYFKRGEYPSDMTPRQGMFWAFAQQYLDEDMEKYEATVERNRINGAKGGRPPKTETQENPKNPVGFKKANKNEMKLKDSSLHKVENYPKEKEKNKADSGLPSMEGRRPSAAVECPPEIAERFGGYKQTASYEREEALRKDGFFEMTALEKAEYLERKRNE